MKILKVSPKGQITIPKTAREGTDRYLFEMKGKVIVLRPVVIKPVGDGLEGFSGLADKSFDFWNDKEDDVYQEFYKND